MTHLNIEKISLSSRDRNQEEQKKAVRKRSILLLLHDYLKNNGFVHTARSLKSESTFDIDEYSVCDNIHLDSILQDFEAYHFLRYQKLPHIAKKIPHDANRSDIRPNRAAKSARRPCTAVRTPVAFENEIKLVGDDSNLPFPDCNGSPIEPIGSFSKCSPEWNALAQLVLQYCGKQDVLSVKWDDIIGHREAKNFLREAIVHPMKYPELFQQTNSIWRSILLYGPPGTGKTLLATAACSEADSKFFRVSASSIVSKWRGESEKIVRVLFDLAKHYSPSVIFIDEIDSLLCHRGNDHEASRRMKTEFFLQMDQMNSSDKFVVILGATNMPWELDAAVVRRMEKRLFIPCPDSINRSLLFQKFLPLALPITKDVSANLDLNYEELSKKCELYSASDIQLVCKEVKMGFVRQIISRLELQDNHNRTSKNVNLSLLTTDDVLAVVGKMKPASNLSLDKFVEWKSCHGCE